MPRRVSDIVAVALCWGSGGALVAAMAAILGWVAYQGASRLDWSFATTYPAPGSLEEGVRGGVLSPLVGTLILILIGSAIALPIGVGTAVFLTEYRRPALLYRLADTSIDLIFGVPSVVLALFGLAFFQHSWLVLLSGKVQSSGQASGQSYLTAGIVISLIALPPIVRSTQSSILSVPTSHREGSYALGKGRLATLRKVVIPGARQGVVTGLILGIGRIAGDTAIVYLLAGGAVLSSPERHWLLPTHLPETLQGLGTSLTAYVFYAAPTGEGNAPAKAYAAALVLMVVMVVINLSVNVYGRRRAAR